MKLSAQEEYGLRCLVQLASAAPGASLTLAEISRREGITQPNIAKTMRLLRRAGFVKATRGQQGGYVLARPKTAIAVGDVLSQLGGKLFDPTFCDRHGGAPQACTHMAGCAVRPVWQLLQDALDQALGAMTLADLLCDALPPKNGPPRAGSPKVLWAGSGGR